MILLKLIEFYDKTLLTLFGMNDIRLFMAPPGFYRNPEELEK